MAFFAAFFVAVERAARDSRNFFVVDDGVAVLHQREKSLLQQPSESGAAMYCKKASQRDESVKNLRLDTECSAIL